MKLSKLIYLLLFITSTASAQNVFVLVDVSGNPKGDVHKITPEMREEAFQLVKSIVTNNYNPSFEANWKLSGYTDPIIKDITQGKGQQLIRTNEYLMIMPFGERDTYDNLRTTLIQNYPSDFTDNFKFPFQYTDQFTYSSLAKAKAAALATEYNLDEYYLIVVMGKGEDTDSNKYTENQKRLIDNYLSAAQINSLAIIRYNNPDIDFKVEISQVSVSKMSVVPPVGPGPVSPPPPPCGEKKLGIVTPQGTKSKPREINGERLNVSWNCKCCSDSSNYTLRVINLDNKKTRSYNIPGTTSRAVKLTPGLNRIVVSGDSLLATPQYVMMKSKGTEGGGFFGILLLLIALAVGGYFLYKYLNNRKPNVPTKAADGFSFGDDSNNGNTDNNDDNEW